MQIIFHLMIHNRYNLAIVGSIEFFHPNLAFFTLKLYLVCFWPFCLRNTKGSSLEIVKKKFLHLSLCFHDLLFNYCFMLLLIQVFIVFLSFFSFSKLIF